MANIAVTAEEAVVGTKIPEADVYDYPVSKYPAATDSIAAYLTGKKNPTAGYKYDTDNWTLWDFGAESGAAIKNNIPVSDKSEIGIDDYNNIVYPYAEELLVYFPETEIKVDVTGVEAPAKGGTPDTEAVVPENGGYSVTDVSWYDGETKLTASDTFVGGKQYTVKVTLTPDTGLAFTETTPATINGETSTATTLNQNGTLTVSLTFDEIALTAITYADVYVTAPALGETPATTADRHDGAHFTVSDVSWSPADAQFKSGVKYTVSAKLTPDSGFAFTANTAAKINDKTATATLNNDGSLTVSFTFDEIALTAISSAAITVTAPARNNAPSTEATLPAGANYTVSDVSWSPNDAQFKSGVKYTVSAKLTPNDGFKFTANTAVKINNKIATAVLNNDGSLTVSYTFGRLGSGSSGGGSGSSSSKTDNGTTSAKTAKSVGWANITNEIKAAVPGSTITITLNSETIIPESALQAAITNKVKLVLYAGAGSKWIIDGAKANSARYTDFGVYTDNVGIPAAAYNSISCSANKQFNVKVDTLNYIAQLNACVGSTPIGKKAVVYFYNQKTGKLMYQKSAVVDKDGCVPVDVACSGSFFIALGSTISDSGCLYGDSNGDGVINALDASEILKNVVSGNPVDNRNADTNADGVVSALDAMYILQYVVGIITKFPAANA